MIRKVLTGTIVLLVLGAFGTISYADDIKDNKIEEVITTVEEEYKVIKPENNLVTSENTVLLSGKSKQGSTITVEVYSEKKSEGKISLFKDEPYLTMNKEKVGELGRFNIELALKSGKNKIIIKIQKNNTIKYFTRFVTITNTNTANEYLKDLDKSKDVNILNNLKNLINNKSKTNNSLN